MHDALLASGRDIVLQPVEQLPFEDASDGAELCQRLADDRRHPRHVAQHDRRSASRRASGRRSPGRATGTIPTCSSSATSAGGRNCTRPTSRADEQYTHISLWCLLSAPLLIGCDLERLDPFTLSLLTNDEVLAVNQDALGKVCRRGVRRARRRMKIIGRPADTITAQTQQRGASLGQAAGDGSLAVGPV